MKIHGITEDAIDKTFKNLMAITIHPTSENLDNWVRNLTDGVHKLDISKYFYEMPSEKRIFKVLYNKMEKMTKNHKYMKSFISDIVSYNDLEIEVNDTKVNCYTDMFYSVCFCYITWVAKCITISGYLGYADIKDMIDNIIKSIILSED